MNTEVSWNSVVVLDGQNNFSVAREGGEAADSDEVSGRSVIHVGLKSTCENGDKSERGISGQSGNVFHVINDSRQAEEQLKAILSNLGVTAPLYCLKDSFWLDYFSEAFSPGKYALKGWSRSLEGSDEVRGIQEYDSIKQGVLSQLNEQFPASDVLGASCPLKVLILISPDSLFVNTTRDYCEAFDLFSTHHFSYASAKRDRSQSDELTDDLDYSNYDVLMIHYSVRIAFSEKTIDKAVMDAIQKFSGYKILFIQDEYDFTEIVRGKITSLGLNEVFTCVPERFVEQVYPKERFPRVKFTSCLTGYLPPNLEVKSEVVTLAERPYQIVYRGRSLAYYYGDLGQEKTKIGKQVKAACEERKIPHDIEWTEDKRVYGSNWFEFLHSGRATLGSESGSNVFDMDGAIRGNVIEALKENPELSYEEVNSRYFDENNMGVRMNQISPKIFEFIASKTALILYEGEYSGVLQPDVHYLSLKKDASNLNEVLNALEDLPKLENMVERTYQDIVAKGNYSYRAFITNIDRILDDRAVKACPPMANSDNLLLQPSIPPKHRELCRRAIDSKEEKKSVNRSNNMAQLLTNDVAHLKSKLGNFHGMLLRRDQKIEKLLGKLGKRRGRGLR